MKYEKITEEQAYKSREYKRIRNEISNKLDDYECKLWKNVNKTDNEKVEMYKANNIIEERKRFVNSGSFGVVELSIINTGWFICNIIGLFSYLNNLQSIADKSQLICLLIIDIVLGFVIYKEWKLILLKRKIKKNLKDLNLI